jgi:hypothetical protein
MKRKWYVNWELLLVGAGLVLFWWGVFRLVPVAARLWGAGWDGL